jgi:hypothetical protein
MGLNTNTTQPLASGSRYAGFIKFFLLMILMAIIFLAWASHGESPFLSQRLGKFT